MREIEDVRLDIQSLIALMEKLDDGPEADNVMYRACAKVLAMRRATLAELEGAAVEQ